MAAQARPAGPVVTAGVDGADKEKKDYQPEQSPVDMGKNSPVDHDSSAFASLLVYSSSIAVLCGLAVVMHGMCDPMVALIKINDSYHYNI